MKAMDIVPDETREKSKNKLLRALERTFAIGLANVCQKAILSKAERAIRHRKSCGSGFE
ncbi:MAG: hypothetical protein PUC47_10115 [Oscillospiraceae bacterium]|nr:hypothetical protein [Oscillospiraceae bacterium]